MIKIVHIHSDPKFLNEVLKFENSEIENSILVIGHENNFRPLKDFKINFFFKDDSNLVNIIELIRDADIIVVNDLCHYKKKIINLLDSSKLILWRFFGTELYSEDRNKFYSLETQSKFGEIKFSIRNYYKSLKKRILDKKIYAKIDFVMMICKEEYDFISAYKSIPKFLQISLLRKTLNKAADLAPKKLNQTIIGNNRNAWNNHLDILNEIKINNIKDYQHYLFFSYGDINEYSNSVKFEVSQLNNVALIEDFLSMDRFNSIYETSSAFILNGYRQMAVANIFTALNCGCKIYMSAKNSVYHFLKHEGFLVFEVNNLSNDLQAKNIQLSLEQMEYNLTKLDQLYDKYSSNQFVNSIMEIYKNKIN